MQRGAIITDALDASRYRELRERVLDVPVWKLAHRLGISPATVYGRLQGTRPISREAVLAFERLVEALETEHE